jgi:hypothetical protein
VPEITLAPAAEESVPALVLDPAAVVDVPAEEAVTLAAAATVVAVTTKPNLLLKHVKEG